MFSQTDYPVTHMKQINLNNAYNAINSLEISGMYSAVQSFYNQSHASNQDASLIVLIAMIHRLDYNIVCWAHKLIHW